MQNPAPIRQNARKGIKDALKTRVGKAKDLSISEEKLQTLVQEIEEELFKLYNRDVGAKYKTRYRSLVFNIKDEKNNGLFRKIIGGKILPKELVAMTPEEMANKELQQWRQASLKNDIEKIKSHELDLIALGNKFVMKSHKGEQMIESDDQVGEGEVKTKMKEKVLLPDDVVEKEEDQEAGWNPKTWEVCNLD